MKKLLVFGLVVGGLAAMTSCKKDYTCSFSDGTASITYTNIGKTQAAVAKSDCTLLGGTWSKD